MSPMQEAKAGRGTRRVFISLLEALKRLPKGACARLEGAGLRLWNGLWDGGGSMREHPGNQSVIHSYGGRCSAIAVECARIATRNWIGGYSVLGERRAWSPRNVTTPQAPPRVRPLLLWKSGQCIGCGRWSCG